MEWLHFSRADSDRRLSPVSLDPLTQAASIRVAHAGSNAPPLVGNPVISGNRGRKLIKASPNKTWRGRPCRNQYEGCFTLFALQVRCVSDFASQRLQHSNAVFWILYGRLV